MRNGSNPPGGKARHWFLGDGMVHGVRLERGKASWYRNRYVATPIHAAGKDALTSGGIPGKANSSRSARPLPRNTRGGLGRGAMGLGPVDELWSPVVGSHDGDGVSVIQEFEGVDTELGAQPFDGSHGQVALAPLDGTDERAVPSDVVPERLLGEPEVTPETAQVRSHHHLQHTFHDP